MILVSFNKNTNKITMASFLRDNYVRLPDGYLPNRLNAAPIPSAAWKCWMKRWR